MSTETQTIKLNRVYWRDETGRLRWIERQKVESFARAMFVSTCAAMKDGPIRYRINDTQGKSE